VTDAVSDPAKYATEDPPTVLSLFSGIGGFDLGLERAGMTTVGQVELDPYCRQVLAKHWPEVPRHDDVRTAADWWRSAVRPRVDLVAGGFPCQGHSVAGRQRGTGDERWGWPWYRDVVTALEPGWVLIENVPNLVRTGLVDVLADLARLGFDAWWNRVPAAALGAPHLRWRLFVIAAHPERVELRHEPGWGGWPLWADQTVVGHDGAAWALADPGSESRRPARVADTGAGAAAPGLRPAEPRGRGSGTDVGAWATESGVARVAHGVPAGVDRRRTLGNAVVPQVAEYVGRMVIATASRPQPTTVSA
jgi:DNA (cytosine-5)-methyltransferase 1